MNADLPFFHLTFLNYPNCRSNNFLALLMAWRRVEPPNFPTFPPAVMSAQLTVEQQPSLHQPQPYDAELSNITGFLIDLDGTM